MHGLVYDHGLLDALPVLDDDNGPVRAISASQFGALHLQHTLAHAPDNVLFPFLHGLEGDNHAQNTFFASSSTAPHRTYPDANVPHPRIPAPAVPNYRGLVWVVCEDDLAKAGDTTSLRILKRKPLRMDRSGEPTPSSDDEEDEERDVEMESDGSSYGDDLDEDEQDMLMMIAQDAADRQREATAAASASETPIPSASPTPTKAPQTATATATAAHPPPATPSAADTDCDATSEGASTPSSSASDTDSPLLASPVSPLLATPVQTQLEMQADGVRILAADGVDSAIGIVEDDSVLGTDMDGLSIVHPSKDALKEEDEGRHMHPVAHRPTTVSSTPTLSIQTAHIPLAPPTPPALMTSASSTSLNIPSASVSPSPTTTAEAPSTATPTASAATAPTSGLSLTHPTDPAAPPLLTSTFRPKELLRRARRASGRTSNLASTSTSNPNSTLNSAPAADRLRGGTEIEEVRRAEAVDTEAEAEADAEGGWEFVPARVPDGISLRNFGIQVPIYATLSDIVIYSPHGSTPAAVALARRFKAAIQAKRAERIRMRLSTHIKDTATTDSSFSPQQQEEREKEAQEKAAAGLLEYNVFVLDATEAELREAVPHLMMRICGAGVPGGTGQSAEDMTGANNARSNSRDRGIGAHTDGPNGHVMEQEQVEAKERKERERRKRDADADADMDMDMVVDMDMGEETHQEACEMDIDCPSPVRQNTTHEEDEDLLHSIPNTVDFALREREEMRDLTKASEIITLHPVSPDHPSTIPAATTLPSPFSWSTFHSSNRGSHFMPPKPAPPVDAQSDSPPSWDPRLGQVFLGNSSDVPLALDVPTQFRHASNVPRDADEAARWDWHALTRHLKSVDGLLAEYDAEIDAAVDDPTLGDDGSDGRLQPNEDDPFNYVATNDPALGFGYDICVECHDLAPFPSAAHLRAADEHLAMMDVMWRQRWEKAWYAREERRARTNSALDSGSESSAEGPDQNADNDDQQNDMVRRRRSTAPVPPPPTPPRPPPHANAVIHLPFPSSPPNSQATMVALMPIVRFLEKWVRPPPPVVRPPVAVETPVASSPEPDAQSANSASSRRWSSVTSLMPSFPSFPGVSGHSQASSKPASAAPTPPPSGGLPPHPSRSRAMTSPSSQHAHSPSPVQGRTRPLKVLLYSSDGYTESSVPALCLLMAIKGLMLPEAYLELQVEKRRSFFVYQADLGILRRVEARLREEREREKEKEREREREREKMAAGAYLSSLGSAINANGKRTAPAPASARGGYWPGAGTPVSTSSTSAAPARSPTISHGSSSFMGRPTAKSVSFTTAPPQVLAAAQHQQQQNQQSQPQAQASSPSGKSPSRNLVPSATLPAFEFGSLPSQSTPHPAAFSTSGNIQHSTDANGGFINQEPQPSTGMSVIKGRPRASTSPWLPSLFGGDHQSWFNDPRFDGSFPSRVLPFLYLGNLNHASNVYMLHALGITHVVSVGECALVPPPHHMGPQGGGATAQSCHRPGPGAHFVPGKGPGGQGSLWIEEREGRIKVLDIKGVCDDGIDTLEPQLEPICDWIDKARQEGGQVLVHCRVGVSRSATVTIAYVMKHLSLPLVDAYLIVRSRRLSVLIQPNMRLLYNLCGWEIKLAKERANDNECKLKKELARTLTWPYLAKEVHALNEKYLH